MTATSKRSSRKNPSAYRRSIHWDRFTISSGNTITNTAAVRLKKDENLQEQIESGDGPLDAAFKGIEKIVGKNLHLDGLRIIANTEGKDALGDADGYHPG